MTYPRRNALTQRFTLGAPRSFTISPCGERILFCRSATGDDPVNKLWLLDLTSEQPSESLLVDPKVLLADHGGDNTLSEAEKARRERLREAGGGIVTYAVHFPTNRVVYVLGSQLYVTDIATGQSSALGNTAGAFDPRFSPDGKELAYCAGGHVHIYDFGTDTARNLTENLNSDSVCASADCGQDCYWGLAEFVAAEEMGRGRGHWYSPDSASLAVTHVDNSDVKKWWISEPVSPDKTPRPIAYPAAGTANATVKVFVVNVANGESVQVLWDRNRYEYLCRVSWNEQGLHLLVQTRDQKTTLLLKVDPVSGDTTTVDEHVDSAWVELIAGCPALSPSGVIDIRDDLETDTRRVYKDAVAFSPVGLQVRSLVCADGGGVFAHTFPTATTMMLSYIDYDGNVAHITDAAGLHTGQANRTFDPVNSDDSRAVAVVTSADMDSALSTTRIIRPGRKAYVVDSYAEAPALDFNVKLSSVGSDELRCALVLPSDPKLLESGPLPVLMDPYGGPHAQRVLERASAFAASQWFADQGFAVIICDGPGTPARGPDFERRVYADLAAPVLEGQILALEEISKQNPGLLDLGRVGIRGWSFGGYLAALAVLERPDIFHVGVAGAPVTDWLLYDTHYTERYLGHPETNPDAYVRSDLTPLANKLERPLMLIHGLADDNVVAAHTFAFSRALLEAGRHHQVLPLSGVSHMTPQAEVAENLLRLQVEFLKRELAVKR